MKLKSHHLLTWIPHLFLFYKERVFRKLLPIMLILAAYEIVVAIFFAHGSRYSLGQFHLIFSFILTIIISFRVNASYARWWEGRILWGSITNNCRNLGLKFNTFVGLQQTPEFYILLKTLPFMTKAYLRKDNGEIIKLLESINIKDNHSKNPIILIMQPMYIIINALRDQNKIRFEQFMALDTHMVNLIEMIGGCERIANTRVPPAFSFFVKQALLFYAIMFPFGWIETFGFLVLPMMIMIIYILLGLEILAEELEEPFGRDDNDLPLGQISRNIEMNIEQIAERTSLSP